MHFLLSVKCSCFLSQRPKTSPCPSGRTCLFTSGTEITPDPCRHSPPSQRQRIHLRTAEQGAGELHKGFPGGLARREATGQPPTGCSWGSPHPPPWHPPPTTRSVPHPTAQNLPPRAQHQPISCRQSELRRRYPIPALLSGGGGDPRRLWREGRSCSLASGRGGSEAGGSRFQPLPGVSRIPPRPVGRWGGRKALMLPSQRRLEEYGPLPLPSWLPAVGRAEGQKPSWAPHTEAGPEWIRRCWEPPGTPTRYLPKPVCLLRAGGVSSRIHPGIPSGTCCVWWPSAESGTSLR